jgi:alkylhydroperoxidase family enzyme
LITYAMRVLTEPSTLTDADVDELREHGWSDRVLADVVGLVALNQLTGAFNLVAGLEPATLADAPAL